jgi:hypothetical protein
MVRSRVVVGIFLITLSAAVAHAQPTTVTVAGETWVGSGAGGTATFRRANGTTVSLSAQEQQTCGQQPRKAPQPRPAWVPGVFYPTVDADGGGLTLCLQNLAVTFEVVVKVPAGVAPGADLAPMLLTIANEARPPTAIPDLGITIHPSAPVYQTQRGSIAFVVDMNGVVIATSRADTGRCGREHAVSIADMGKIDSSLAAPPGYWPTVVKKTEGGTLFYCFETADGFLTVFANVAAPTPLVDDLLVEIRRASLAAFGAPVSTDGELTLPRTGQRVAQPRVGRWKVVDGATVLSVTRPITGDALVSIGGFTDGTSFTVGVSEDGCTPGTTPLDPTTTARVFPAAVGTAWLDSDQYGVRWHAHACIDAGGTRATVLVAADMTHMDAPAGRDADHVRALVAKIALSYGLAVTDDVAPAGASPSPPYSPPYDPGGGGGSPRGKASGHFGIYGGIIRLEPDSENTHFGGLLGFNLRAARARGGFAGAMDLELGYGNGETIGEIRAGAGFAVASRTSVFDVMGGLSVGSTGPGAALDAYVDASLGFYGPGRMFWVGAMRAWGVDGPGHYRLDLKLAMPKQGTDAGVLVGMRYLQFDKDDETMMDNGKAFLVTLGWAFARAN